MKLRAVIALASLAAVLTAWAVLYKSNPFAAQVAAVAAFVGAAAALLLPWALGPAEEMRPRESIADPPERAAGGGPTPSVATAVAAGEAPAAALLEVTMDSMREAVVIIDSAMRVAALNNSARAAFRSGGGDALSPIRLGDLTRNPSVYSAFAAAVARGERAEVKIEMEAGASRRVYDLHVAPLRQREVVYGSDVRGAVGVFYDITELERLESVRQEFLSNVSHELRTPLTAIVTFVETLQDGALEEAEAARRFLSVIGRNAGRMRTLIEDIMELSSIESGGTRLEPREVSLSAVVREAFGALAAKAADCGVGLVNEVPAEATVRADPRRLEQMLLNLLDNAIKYSGRGGTATVRHERGERDLVSVSDTGVGIPEEHQPRLFERFYRVDRARSRELGGTGLGLAIVKHLARAHGGEARVSSTPGAGSTFTIELPRDATPPRAQKES